MSSRNWTFHPEDISGTVKQLWTSKSAPGYCNKHNPPFLTSDTSPNPTPAVLSPEMPEGTDKPIAYDLRATSAGHKLIKEALEIITKVKKP